MSRSSNSQRPTGIIRTLPYYGGLETNEPLALMKERARNRLIRSMRRLEVAGEDCTVYIALATKPLRDVLHCYLLVDGFITVRANIAGYIAGAELGTVRCWDGMDRNCPWWAMLTAPVTWAPEPIKMRGFQGFRYVHDPLW